MLVPQFSYKFAVVLTLGIASGIAQPVIGSGGVLNVASYAYADLPNGSIAQGSVFAIFGSGLGPGTSPALAYPLQPTLGGVSVSVSHGPTKVAALPIFVSPAQINVILPSNTPTGSDSITVSYQGQTSAAQTVQVVANSVGIFSLNQTGSGQGIFTDISNNVIQYNAPAAPGQTVVLWGTGLGAISGIDANTPPVGNVPGNSPIVRVGGVAVTPSYHGRSGCCAGVDQIVFTIPSNVSGCNVPVAVETSDVTSNYATIAVAPSGSPCSGPSGLSGSDFTTYASQGGAALGILQYQSGFMLTQPGLLGGTSTSSGNGEFAGFFNYQLANFTALPGSMSAGACSVITFRGTNGELPVSQALLAGAQLAGALKSSALDAGASILAVTGNTQGTINATGTSTGLYRASFTFPPGSYTFSGSGGKDVGTFSVGLDLPQLGLTWTNRSSFGGISRSLDSTVTWTATGTTSDSIVEISGYSIGGASPSAAVGAGFTCTAHAADGTFTIPASVLRSLPASASFGSSFTSSATGVLGVSLIGTPVRFQATGLDLGLAFPVSASVNKTLLYQ